MSSKTNVLDNLSISQDIRKNISQFLDSYENIKYANTPRELKILSWPEIYFELGKLKEEIDNHSQLSLISNRLDFLEAKIQKIEPCDKPCDDN